MDRTKSQHGEMEWDGSGRLIIHDETIRAKIQAYVGGAAGPVQGRDRMGRRTKLFQVGGTAPHETDPQDLLCGIIIEIPWPVE